MPELPEVENIARSLREQILNLSIRKFCLRTPVIVKGPFSRRPRQVERMLLHQRIRRISRRAKRIVLFINKDLSLVMQLGMTGCFLVCSPGAAGNTNQHSGNVSHLHFYINFSKNKQLQFLDPRRFGRLWLIPRLNPDQPDAAMEQAGMGKLGPEPAGFSAEKFFSLFKTDRVVKTLLLDQSRIAGLGNIYADESLFAAGIHPATPCKKISYEKACTLLQNIRLILQQAILHGGTTFSDYRNAYGEMGAFKKMLQVYQRTDKPCPRCQTPVKKIVIAGRSSHFCPRCQKNNCFQFYENGYNSPWCFS